MVSLKLAADLTSSVCAGWGRPEAVFFDAGRALVCGMADGPSPDPEDDGDDHFESGRRVVLHGEDKRVVAFLTHQVHEINEVAFHPELPLIVMAKGSYDGGYEYEGELLAWRWDTGETRSLLDYDGAVLSCRFTTDGDLLIRVTPASDDADYDRFLAPQDPTDDSRPPADFIRAYDTSYEAIVPAQNVVAGEPLIPQLSGPQQPGFGAIYEAREARRDLACQFVREHLGAEAPRVVGDIAWLDDTKFIACLNDGTVEIWDIAAGRVSSTQTHGNKVDLLTDHAGNVIVNCTVSDPVTGPSASYISRVTPGGLSLIGSFEHCGVLLDQKDTSLVAVEYSWQSSAEVKAWIYDEEQRSWQRLSQPVRRPWSVSRADEQLPNAVEVAGNVRVSAFRRGSAGYLQGSSIDDKSILWTLPTPAAPVCVETASSQGLVCYSQANNTLGIARLDTGLQIATTQTTIEGIPTQIVSIAMRGHNIATGSLDGRVLLWTLEDTDA